MLRARRPEQKTQASKRYLNIDGRTSRYDFCGRHFDLIITFFTVKCIWPGYVLTHWTHAVHHGQHAVEAQRTHSGMTCN